MAFTQQHLNEQSLDIADYWYRQGHVSYKEWQKYRCLWRNSSPRFSNECAEHEGHNPESCPLIKPSDKP